MSSFDGPVADVRDAVARALAEDLGPLGDITAALVPRDARAVADVVARADGVIAGTACATEVFAQLDPDVQVNWLVDDGGLAGAGAKVGYVTGPLRSVLTGERTALNFLCHLSGVATATHHFVLAAGDRVRVLDTRKTLPGLRSLEKAAVRAGGGANHRGSLSDLVLLKDNHLAGIGITRGGATRARHVARSCGRSRVRPHRAGRGSDQRRSEHGAARQHDSRRGTRRAWISSAARRPRSSSRCREASPSRTSAPTPTPAPT